MTSGSSYLGLGSFLGVIHRYLPHISPALVTNMVLKNKATSSGCDMLEIYGKWILHAYSLVWSFLVQGEYKMQPVICEALYSHH